MFTILVERGVLETENWPAFKGFADKLYQALPGVSGGGQMLWSEPEENGAFVRFTAGEEPTVNVVLVFSEDVPKTFRRDLPKGTVIVDYRLPHLPARKRFGNLTARPGSQPCTLAEHIEELGRRSRV